VPTSAEFCFGMNSGAASTPTVRPEGVANRVTSASPANDPALALS
jgi:hypothetical protein